MRPHWDGDRSVLHPVVEIATPTRSAGAERSAASRGSSAKGFDHGNSVRQLVGDSQENDDLGIFW